MSFQSLRVKELKIMMKVFGLDDTGNKKDLLDRLVIHMEKEGLTNNKEDHDDEEDSEEKYMFGKTKEDEFKTKDQTGEQMSIVVNAYDKPPTLKQDTSEIQIRNHLSEFDEWKKRNTTTQYQLQSSIDASILRNWRLSGRLKSNYTEEDLRATLQDLTSRSEISTLVLGKAFSNFVFVLKRYISAQENAIIFRNQVIQVLERNAALHYLEEKNLLYEVLRTTLKKTNPSIIGEEVLAKLQLKRAKGEEMKLYEVEDELKRVIELCWKYNNTKRMEKELFCGYCKIKGHEESECRKKKAKTKFEVKSTETQVRKHAGGNDFKAKQSLNIVREVTTSSLVEMKGELMLEKDASESLPVSVMFDSGANVNAIGVNHLSNILALVNSNGLQWGKSPVSVEAVGKEEIICCGMLSSLYIKVQNSKVRSDFLVLKRELPSIILGNQVIQALGLNIGEEIKKRTNECMLVDTTTKEKPRVNVLMSKFPEMKERWEEGYLPNIRTLHNSEYSVEYEEKVIGSHKVTKDQLFRVYNQLTEEGRKIVDELFDHMEEWLYTGKEAIQAEPFKVTLIEGERPCNAKGRRMQPTQQVFLIKKTKENDDKALWEPSESCEWSSFMFAVPKATQRMEDEKYRAVVDYTMVNKKIKADNVTLPFLDAGAYKLQQSQYFGKLDAERGYLQC